MKTFLVICLKYPFVIESTEKIGEPKNGRTYIKNMSSGLDIDIALPGQDLGSQHFAMIREELHLSRGTLHLYHLLLEIYKNWERWYHVFQEYSRY